jgi:hypothetical protein
LPSRGWCGLAEGVDRRRRRGAMLERRGRGGRTYVPRLGGVGAQVVAAFVAIYVHQPLIGLARRLWRARRQKALPVGDVELGDSKIGDFRGRHIERICHDRRGAGRYVGRSPVKEGFDSVDEWLLLLRRHNTGCWKGNEMT